MAEKQPAVLDTSFWTVGHRADVNQYLHEYYEVRVPPAVRAEILRPDPSFPRRRYGYAQMFRNLEGRLLQSVSGPTTPLDRFGLGEAEALALAGESESWLLINDRPPYEFARRAGIRVLSVPGFIAFLYQSEFLSLRSTERKFESIASVTSGRVSQPAWNAIDRLAGLRGERG
jgi:predicted nucleic acid-binding protein